MIKTDFTTIYSAEILMDQQKEMDSPQNRWFWYCLYYLTAELLRQNEIALFYPPKANEKKRTLPLLLDELSNGNYQFSYVPLTQSDKKTAVAETKKWIEANENTWKRLLTDTSLLNDPGYVKWKEWHEKYEWPGKVFIWYEGTTKKKDVVGPEFREYVNDLAGTSDSDKYTRDTLDVIFRGYYYRLCMPDDGVGLHPIRISLLKNTTDWKPHPLPPPRISPVAGYVMAAFMDRAVQEKEKNARVKIWVELLKKASPFLQKFENEARDEDRAVLSKTLGLSKPSVVENTLKVIIQIIDWASKVGKVGNLIVDYLEDQKLKPIIQVSSNVISAADGLLSKPLMRKRESEAKKRVTISERKAAAIYSLTGADTTTC